MPRTMLESEAAVESLSPTLAERRRQQICDAAVALFAERGYVETKIEDISNSIGVGKGLIYRYFEDKQDVLFHALCTVLDKYRSENFLGQLRTLGPLPALRHLLSFHCTQAQLHTQEVILAYRSTKDLSPEQRKAYYDAENKAVDLINADFYKYAHHVTAHAKGALKPNELLKAFIRYKHVDYYDLTLFGRAYDWMKARGLTEGQSEHSRLVVS